MKPMLPLLLAATLAAPLAAHADATATRALLEARLPRLKIDTIRPTPWPELYEVYADGALLYTDPLANYLIRGPLLDTRTHKNLTAERMQELEKAAYAALPFADAITIVKGDGHRQLAVFEDPDCPYCRKLEGELAGMDNLTVHVFLYPIEALHHGASEKSRKIWCAQDRNSAWLRAVHAGEIPDNPGSCDTPLERLAALGRKMRVTGTPTIFLPDGRRISGSLPAARLESILDAAVPAPAAPDAKAPRP